MIRNIVLLILILFSTLQLYAQNLTGTWEGILDNDEKLRVNIQMKKNDLCGYTSDYVIRRPSSYCRANFRGWYDDDEEVWVLVGTSFIENSGDHILMILRLWHEPGDPPDVMRGTEEPKYRSSSLFDRSERGTLRIRKISSEVPSGMPDCFPKVIRPDKPLRHREVTVKPRTRPVDKEKKVVIVPKTPEKKIPVKPPTKPIVKAKPVIKEKSLPVTKTPVPVIKPDTTKKTEKVIIIPTIPVKVDPELKRKLLERKNTEFSHLVVNDKSITLNVYDNGIVDNDSVSIFYNGKLLVGKKRLSEKPITIHLQLDENASLHEIVMFAENLGSIPPNTALIVVNAGNKRYELHSSASLTENAVLTFEYKPK